jgi:predicted nucleic acid-binding protein
LIRVFLDANVLFSAALRPRDRDYAFFRIAGEGGCTLLASSYALGEAHDNLAVKAPAALPRLESLALSLELVAEPSAAMVAQAVAEGLPAKDAPILAAAMGCRADLLVTGDRRHFGVLFGRTVHGVRILSLADGLAAVLVAVAGDVET